MKFPQIALLAKPRPHQVRALNAIGACLRRNGYRVRESYDLTAPEPVVFCWSWGKAMIQRQKFPDAIICTLDHGYTRDRAKLINTGWSLPHMQCGLNGYAEHAVVDDPSRAEARWPNEVEPVRPKGVKKALLLGQVYGDAMVATQIMDYGLWLRNTSEDLQAKGYDVTFRPHPVMVRRGQQGAYGNLGRVTGRTDLRSDLLSADLCVALNSNGLVEAYLMGIEARAWNAGSMLGPIMRAGVTVPWEVRETWFHRLAWTQWAPEELEDGTWFKYHAPIMHRLVEKGEVRPWFQQRLW